MRRRPWIGLAIAVGILASGSTAAAQSPRAAAPAGPVQYRIDPERSQVTFKAYSLLQNAEGRFHRFEGQVTVDPRNLSTARLAVTVDVASIDTKIQKRDNHLRSPDFFDVDRYPTIAFESTGVTPADGRATVKGRLTMRGVTREIEVPVDVAIADDMLTARGEFSVNRLHYEITYQSIINPVKDVVDIAFTFVARRATP
jgi:polyisoprenoid-binding protein YceI